MKKKKKNLSSCCSVKIKESEKIKKYLGFARELKKTGT